MTKRDIVVMIISFIICGIIFILYNFWCNGNGSSVDSSLRDNTQIESPPFYVDDATTVTLTRKTSGEDPDMVVNNKYVATIDGETVEIPLTKTDTENKNGNQVVVSHQVDMTPVIEKLGESEYDRDWSVGSGIGIDNNSDIYIPLSIERHFNKDRSLEMIVGVDTDGSGVENTTILYKCHF